MLANLLRKASPSEVETAERLVVDLKDAFAAEVSAPLAPEMIDALAATVSPLGTTANLGKSHSPAQRSPGAR